MFCQALCDSICKNLIWLPSSLYPIWNDNLWQFTDQEDTKLHLHGSNIPKTMTAVHLTTIVCKLEIRVRNNPSPVYCSSGYNYITHKYGNSFQILILVRFLLKKGGVNEGGGEGEGEERGGEGGRGEGNERLLFFSLRPFPLPSRFYFYPRPMILFLWLGKNVQQENTIWMTQCCLRRRLGLIANTCLSIADHILRVLWFVNRVACGGGYVGPLQPLLSKCNRTIISRKRKFNNQNIS